MSPTLDEARYRAAEQRMWDSVGVTPTERRIQLEHVGVSVRVQEIGDGPTVVFVHGATNGGTSWATLAARMPGFRCLLLDRPGCGLSDPLPHRFENLDELGAFADTLIVDVLDAVAVERAHVVATSYGGYTAFRGVAAHPDRIERVVELGYSIGATRIPASVRFTRVPLVSRAFAAMPINERTVRALLRRIGLRHALETGSFTQTALDWYVSLLRDTDTMRNELATNPHFPLFTMDDRALLPTKLLASITTAVFLLWGEDDPFGGPDVARRFLDLLPNAELELMPRAGHAPWMDDAEHAAAVTNRFLENA